MVKGRHPVHPSTSQGYVYTPLHPFLTLLHPSPPLPTPLHPSSPLFTPLHPSSPLFTPLHPSSPLFTPYHQTHQSASPHTAAPCLASPLPSNLIIHPLSPLLTFPSLTSPHLTIQSSSPFLHCKSVCLISHCKAASMYCPSVALYGIMSACPLQLTCRLSQSTSSVPLVILRTCLTCTVLTCIAHT